ncbi:hypothetical protein ACIPYQ_40975 [Streptomyces sp. NPDC090045]|uniref:hypothetical protein n=1 Tax=Streptomyces sp. NPDC090045 TaxID=3365927 RepID=UPI003827AD23
MVSDVITFDYDSETRVEIKVLGGDFAIIRGDDVMHSGKKAFELLMRLKEFTFEGALEWIAESTPSRRPRCWHTLTSRGAWRDWPSSSENLLGRRP